MINTLEIVDELFLGLFVADVLGAITGNVYKMQRPLDSKLVDIVINCLPTNNLQVQTAVANVNIHVPNLSLGSAAGVDNTQANIPKLRALTNLVISKLNDKYPSGKAFWYDVQQQNVFAEPNINEHYSNVRVNFYSINI